MACSAEESLDLLTAGVLVIDRAGVVARANRSSERILRRPRDGIVGRAVDEVLAPPSQLDASATHDPTERPEATLILPDGTTTTIGFSAGTPNERGDRAVLFKELEGVHELRRERDRLLQLAALGDALPSILHELRNPLAAITSMLELLVEDGDERHQRDIHAVLWEVRRIGLVLQGLGGVVSAAQGEGYAAVDTALHEACRILEPTARRKAIALVDAVPTLPLLPIDRGVVSGVVFNLVKNALDACTEGDTVRVSARLSRDETFSLEVADDGPGMSADVLARCRELFFTTKEHGSGVGLALCSQIAASSGGSLEVTTAPGEGTTVTLSFPIHRPSGPSPTR